MLGRKHHVSRAIKRVRSGREDANFVASIVDSGYREIDFRAFAAANPVMLAQFDAFEPIELVELIQQSLRVGRDRQQPLQYHEQYDRQTEHHEFSNDKYP